MKFFVLAVLWLALQLGGMPNGYCEDARVVLVTAAVSKITPLTRRQLRAIYVGLPVTQNGYLILPIVNESDADLYQEFLQKMMFMSDENYRRQVTVRVFRKGGERIRRVADAKQLINALRATPLSVSFIESEIAATSDDIRVLQILW